MLLNAMIVKKTCFWISGNPYIPIRIIAAVILDMGFKI